MFVCVCRCPSLLCLLGYHCRGRLLSMCLDSGGSGLGCSQHHRWPGSLTLYRHSSLHSFSPLNFSHTVFLKHAFCNERLPKNEGVAISVTVFVLSNVTYMPQHTSKNKDKETKNVTHIVFSKLQHVFSRIAITWQIMTCFQQVKAVEFYPAVSLMCLRS